MRLKTAANAAGRVVLSFMAVTFLFYEGPFSRGASTTSHNNFKPAMDGATKVVTPIRKIRVRKILAKESEDGNQTLEQECSGAAGPGTNF